MLPEFAASLPALAGLCQPAAGGAASLPPPLASGDGLCPSDGLPEVSGTLRAGELASVRLEEEYTIRMEAEWIAGYLTRILREPTVTQDLIFHAMSCGEQFCHHIETPYLKLLFQITSGTEQ